MAGLHALEWRFDGPLPAAALAALGATPAELAARTAAADGALLDRLAREAVRALAAARHEVGAATGPGALAALDRHPARARLSDSRQAALRRCAGAAVPA